MSDNMMPGFNGDSDPQGFIDEDMERAFRAGAQQMREMLARFVEYGNDGTDPKVIAQSMRANWVPNWGKDPGKADDVHDDIWAAL